MPKVLGDLAWGSSGGSRKRLRQTCCTELRRMLRSQADIPHSAKFVCNSSAVGFTHHGMCGAHKQEVQPCFSRNASPPIEGCVPAFLCEMFVLHECALRSFCSGFCVAHVIACLIADLVACLVACRVSCLFDSLDASSGFVCLFVCSRLRSTIAFVYLIVCVLGFVLVQSSTFVLAFVIELLPLLCASIEVRLNWDSMHMGNASYKDIAPALRSLLRRQACVCAGCSCAQTHLGRS